MSDDKEEKRENTAWGVGGLGCAGAVIFYFVLGLASYMLGLHEINNYSAKIPSYLAYGTKPYWFIPVVVLGLVWLALRRRYPDAAKGVRFALFVSAALSLGATAICR